VAEIVLQAKIRTQTGYSTANALRRAGRVPGVFYLHNTKNYAIEVEALDLRPLVYTSETHIVDLQLDNGTSEKCIMRDIQFDPITDKIVHFDLIGLVMSEVMEFEVPVVLEGSSIGVREGGILNHILHKALVKCLPANLPEHIVVDISELKVGDIYTIGDIKIDGVEVLAEPDMPVVMIAHHRGAVEEHQAKLDAEEAGEEPEVIAKGKTAKED
jgi:large subunit ribosomal protein L25